MDSRFHENDKINKLFGQPPFRERFMDCGFPAERGRSRRAGQVPQSGTSLKPSRFGLRLG